MTSKAKYLLLGSTLLALSGCADAPGTDTDPDRGWGSPGDGHHVDRVVRLGSKPTWANVGYGQNVEFVVKNANGSERTFRWRFNGWPDKNMIRLSSVAPPDFFDQEVRIYITRQAFGG